MTNHKALKHFGGALPLIQHNIMGRGAIGRVFEMENAKANASVHVDYVLVL